MLPICFELELDGVYFREGWEGAFRCVENGGVFFIDLVYFLYLLGGEVGGDVDVFVGVGYVSYGFILVSFPPLCELFLANVAGGFGLAGEDEGLTLGFSMLVNRDVEGVDLGCS